MSRPHDPGGADLPTLPPVAAAREPRGVFHTDRMRGATIWRLTFLAVQGGGSVILFALLAHALPKRALAAIAVSQAVLVIAQTLGDFGLSQAAVTVLPTRVAADPQRAPDLLSSAATAYFGAALAALLLTVLAAAAVPGIAKLTVLVSAPAAAATVIVAGADGILRSQGQFRAPTVLMAASELGGFAGVPVAFATRSALLTATAVSAGTTVGALGALVALERLRRGGAAKSVRQFVRACLPLGLSQVFITLGTRADTLLAGAITGLVAAGAFEGAWRIYQLGQYAVGGVATAAAPFVADALGAGRLDEALRLMRRLLIGLFALGLALGAFLLLARDPISVVFAGALSRPVERVLPVIVIASPLGAAGLVAFYTLISRDGQRRFVLAAHAAGAAINIAVGLALTPPMGARGAMIGCASGISVTQILLLVRLRSVIQGIRPSEA